MSSIFPTTIISGVPGNMNGTSKVCSKAIDLRTAYAMAIQAFWVGNAFGTLIVEGSIDYNPNFQIGVPLNPGHWDNMEIVPFNSPSGTDASTLIDITATGIPWIRLVYINTSGAGTITANANTKG